MSVKPDCKRCRKKGAACWQHGGERHRSDSKPKGIKDYGPWDEVPGRCNGKKTDGTGLCRMGAGARTTHPGIGKCVFHYGNTPAHKKHAERVMAERAQATYGLPREVDPHTALLEEVHRTAGHVAWLALVIQSYDTPEDLTYGKTKQIEQRGERKLHPVREAAPAVWLDLYARERLHLTNVCKTAIACGLAERHVRLAEEQGQLLAQAMRDFAAALAAEYGFDSDSEVVRSAARRSLTLVASNSGAAA